MADFVGLFNASNLDPQQQARARAMQLAQQDPWTQVNYGRNFGGEMAGAGAAGLIRGGLGALSGADTRTREEKLAAIKQQVQEMVRTGKLNPAGRQGMLTVLVQLLSQAGLIDEAQQAARELEGVKSSAADSARKDRELSRKEAADRARQANMEARVKILQDANSKPDDLLKEYAKTYEQLESGDYETPAEKARLQATLQGLAARLKIKPEKKGNEWRVTVTPSTKNAEGQIIKYNTVTGETKVEALNNRVAGGGGDGGEGDVGDAPAHPVTPLKDQVDSEGRQIYKDKKSDLWVLTPEGWQRAQGGSRDTRDRAMPEAQKKAVVDLEVVIDQVANILEMMASQTAAKYVGIPAYANKFMDLADRVQADGVPLRARLTDLGSFVLHARSGAAVTAQEFDRLRGFIPQATDSFKAARNKLLSMRQVAVSRANAIRRTLDNPEKTYAGVGSGGSARQSSAAKPAVPQGSKPIIRNW